MITKHRLVQLIDSILDLKKIDPQHLELIHYYSSILNSNHADTVWLQGINLHTLSFYSESDEKALFPLANLSESPESEDLIIENGHLSFFSIPFEGVITSNYGYRDGKIHRGIDIDLNKGDKIHAAFDGKIRLARFQGGYGNVVVIMHPNGLETVYAHLSRLKVKAGDIVQSGQVIGLGGSTGHSTGSHLHFEMRFRGHALNPGLIVSFQENKLYYHTITIEKTEHSLTAFPSNSHLHKVKKGDSWPIIARKYGISISELLVLNGTGTRFYLKAGQQLRVN